MFQALTHAIAGCKDLPHVGPHPGRHTMVFLGCLMGAGGAQNGWGGLLTAVVLYGVTLGPMYLMGGMHGTSTTSTSRRAQGYRRPD